MSQYHDRRKGPFETIHPFALAGGAVGSAFGPMGAALGTAAGSLADYAAGQITGSGEYKIRGNSLSKRGVPVFKSAPHVRITHKEKLFDILSSDSAGVFNNVSYSVNPANGGLYTWLPGIANNFTEYRIHGMFYTFVSTSGEAVGSTNTALGKVMMTVNYDPTQPPYSTSTELENSDGAVVSRACDNAILFVECAKGSDILDNLIVGEPTSVGDDIRFHDFCTLQIASQGCQGTGVNLGEIYACYDIEFFKPKISPVATLTHSIGAHWRTEPSSTNEFMVNASSSPHNSSLIQIVDSKSGITIAKTGRFLAVRTLTVSGSISGSPFMGVGTNTTIVNSWNWGTEGSIKNALGGTTMYALCMFDVVTHAGTAGVGNLTIGTCQFTGALVGADFHIYEVPTADYVFNTDPIEVIRQLLESKGLDTSSIPQTPKYSAVNRVSDPPVHEGAVSHYESKNDSSWTPID